MKKYILINLLLAVSIGLSHAAKLPSEDYFEAPYQTGSGDDYYSDDYSNSNQNGDYLSFSTRAGDESEACQGVSFQDILDACAACGYEIWGSAAGFNSGCSEATMDAFDACIPTKTSEECDSPEVIPVGSATPLLIFVLAYAGKTYFTNRKRKEE